MRKEPTEEEGRTTVPSTPALLVPHQLGQDLSPSFVSNTDTAGHTREEGTGRGNARRSQAIATTAVNDSTFSPRYFSSPVLDLLQQPTSRTITSSSETNSQMYHILQAAIKLLDEDDAERICDRNTGRVRSKAADGKANNSSTTG